MYKKHQESYTHNSYTQQQTSKVAGNSGVPVQKTVEANMPPGKEDQQDVQEEQQDQDVSCFLLFLNISTDCDFS